jgi:hypothetical protein
MARLVLVTHEYDAFAFRQPGSDVVSPYLLFDVLKYVETLGHSWQVTSGPKAVPGDVALLHVDATVVGEEYLSLREHYAKTINFGTGDISKQKISRLILKKGETWNGQVIVKSNYNNRAVMEHLHNQRALLRGQPKPHPEVSLAPTYRVFDGVGEIGEDVWTDPRLIVERFTPEKDAEGGFVLRTWVFIGSRERCTRMVTSSAISKAADVLRYEPASVPDELREIRRELQFDFGKFDFVIHDGKPLLLDANRTPGVARAIEPLMKAGVRNLADGLNELIGSG